MKNIKININRPALNRADIESHKDFDALMKRFEEDDDHIIFWWWRGPWMWGSLAGLTVAASLLFIFFFNGYFGPDNAYVCLEDGQITDALHSRKSFISPPLPGVNIPFATYMVDGCKGDLLVYNKYSKINIPANAFLDSNGQVICGPVKVEYRELHDQVDFFLSGIPMEYDSAGTRYTFESAGMIQLFAYHEGQPLHMNPDCKVKIEMISYQPGDKYNLYELDTIARNWICRGKDKVTMPESLIAGANARGNVAVVKSNEHYLRNNSTLGNTFQLNAEVKKWEKALASLPGKLQDANLNLQVIRRDIRDLEKTAPAKPKGASGGPVFILDVKKNEFPELTDYKNVEFEVPVDYKYFDTTTFGITWKDVELYKKRDNTYILTLTKDKIVRIYPVQPVLRGKNYELAMAEFNAKYGKYEELLAKRRAEEAAQEKEYQRLLAEQKRINEEQQRAYAEIRKKQRKEAWILAQKDLVASKDATVTTGIITRTFYASDFGTWNCDKPQPPQSGAQVAARYVNEEGKKLSFETMYLIAKDQNIMYNVAPKKELEYDPSIKNMLLGVTKNNKLAVCHYLEFTQGIKRKRAELVMQVHDLDFTTEAEVRTFLKMKDPSVN